VFSYVDEEKIWEKFKDSVYERSYGYLLVLPYFHHIMAAVVPQKGDNGDPW
jgi:hypothetical protein